MPKTKALNNLFNKVKMVPVTSSQINAIGFLEPNNLFIEFSRETVYHYTPVPKETYEEMLKAESVGKYFHANIKHAFTITCTKLQP